MRRVRKVGTALVACAIWSGAGASLQAQVALEANPLYVARYVPTGPVVDGLLTTAEEWQQASAIVGNWHALGAGVLDRTNNRFAAVWNDAGLFLLHQVDYGQWADRAREQIDFGYETLNFYFDPNRDGESNANALPTDSGIDGYQIAFNQPLGMSEIRAGARTAGFYTEAHVNSPFGDQGGPFSRFHQMVVVQNTSNDERTGYTEVFIPWSNFDAANPDTPGALHGDTGLYHPESPLDGEQWYFNVGRIQTNGVVPAWASSATSQFLASRPHGVLEFRRDPTNPGDFNGDGRCDDLDIDLLAAAIRAGKTEPRFDVNSDGWVNEPDRVYYIEELKNTYIGDSNLDGQFNTSDFVLAFQRGEYEDGIVENSGWAAGDWNGDGEFGTTDFVFAFQGGAFERGPRAATAVVPEPTGMGLLFLALPWMARRFSRAAMSGSMMRGATKRARASFLP